MDMVMGKPMVEVTTGLLGTQPALGAALPHGPPTSTPPAGARRVLVVDDNVDAADSLGMLLQSSGHAVRVEYSAQAALRSARQFLPDAIFCDIGMPGMDGHAFARHLRQDHDFAATTLVALTGWGSADDLRRSRAAGLVRW